ncbi:hypothetical protein F8M41_012159 [Gigaspora margarita]|uniref:Uncharacterized protein n=1 Tax=Gigaspora margarita TaxID=4874 RepID=A0A8H4A037_GIGMA|nr:hypothetical protein F8M41_012159 [Gigaspora margarita]
MDITEENIDKQLMEEDEEESSDNQLIEDNEEENIDNQLMEEDKEKNIDNQLMEEDEEIKINCLFKNLVEIYKDTDLQLIKFQYYSKLENILESLDKYVICEKHYNQVIRNDNFIKRLQNNLQFSTSINKEYNGFKEQLEKITNQLKECKQQKLFDINLIKELEINNNNLKTENNQLKVKNNQLINENNQLKEIINLNFNDQQIHIKLSKK